MIPFTRTEREALDGFLVSSRASNSTLTMLVTPSGICFHELRSFWFLSFSEIDRYLNDGST
jgi:hypothetical protein